ncbi:2OG-Fe dioxygenase family protein [Streptomyces decoyicus]|uniref:2OG-Fe dioxygenase family protein n=1 Tax=Streptomyces decoyicus TaxID=249567 RepID=UPI003401DBEF
MDEISESFWASAGPPAFQEPPPAVAAARESLGSVGVHLIPAATVRSHLGTGEEEWARFATHWDDLSQDRYAGGEGRPTPEGRHRDGVTLVSWLLVSRNNASGGRSTALAPDGPELLSATLDEPASLLLSDDRRTLHAVSPIRPLDPSRHAHRDVLVTTLAPARQWRVPDALPMALRVGRTSAARSSRTRPSSATATAPSSSSASAPR